MRDEGYGGRWINYDGGTTAVGSVAWLLRIDSGKDRDDFAGGLSAGLIATNLAFEMAAFADHRRLGLAVIAPTGFQIARDPDTVRVPDVAFIRAERIPPGGARGFFQGVPDIAVEILSPSDRPADVVTKTQDWLQAGCSIVWTVDPEARTVTVHRADGQMAVLSDADILTGGDVLPGFSVPAAEVFT
jgi:Uma2 family endonuclease